MRPLSATDPRTVDRYRLLGVLGGGGMGRVYLGQSPAGRRLAVKVIRSDLADDPVFRQRFTREVASVRAVSPLFTAAVVDADTEADPPWLATTYIEGPSLRDWVATHGPLLPGPALVLAAGLAEALASIHASGLVHRDLKPSNVLLDDAGPRIIDFGIAVSPESTRLTTSIVGTPSYLAPELVGGGEPEPASDIFSLGATLVFATTGVPLVHDGTMLQQLVQISTARFDLSAVPRELRAIVVRCLSRRPRDRPTADELARVLVGAGLPAPEPGWYHSAVPVTAPVKAPAPVPRRRVLVLGGLAGLTLAAGGAGVAAALERDRRDDPPRPGSVLWLASSGAPAPVGPPPRSGPPSDRILVAADSRLVSATGTTVSAVDRQGRSLWRRALGSGPLALRPWRGGVLVTNAASAWLLDPATGRPAFTAAATQPGIGEVALSGSTAFLDLGTAVGALDGTGRWAWHRDGLGTPLAADSATLVTRTVSGGTVAVTLADPRTGVPRWSIRYPVPAPLPERPPPDGPPPDGPPPDGPAGDRPPPQDPAWTRSQARLGAGIVALRDAQALRVVHASDGQTVWQADSAMPVAGVELTGDLLLVCADRLIARSVGSGGQAWEAPVRGARLAVSQDGGTIVAAADDGVTALDRYGTVRWHTPWPAELSGAVADRVTITDSAAVVTFRPGPNRRTTLDIDVLALALG